MKYKNEYGKIELKIPEKYKKIGISLSGGCDSSFLSFLVLKYFKDNNFNPPITFISGVIKKKGVWKIFYIQEIIDFLSTNYPKANINQEILFIDDLKEIFDYEKKLLTTNNIDLFINGSTKNPPYEDLIKYDMLEGRLTYRDEEYREIWRYKELGGDVYKPLINVNKKFIAQGYKDFELIETLYPKTISCEKIRNNDNFNEMPCKKCWWCKEKHWAFGVYDKNIS